MKGGNSSNNESDLDKGNILKAESMSTKSRILTTTTAPLP
jgi:hypothetical protein